MHKKAKFVADRYYWIIIKNKNYEILRNDPNWSAFADIPNVDADAVNAKNGFMSLGANICDITTVENASFEDLKNIFGGIQRNVIQNWAGGNQKSLIFVYYAGHGVMDNTVYAVCNGGIRPSKYVYALQSRLNSLAK